MILWHHFLHDLSETSYIRFRRADNAIADDIRRFKVGMVDQAGTKVESLLDFRGGITVCASWAQDFSLNTRSAKVLEHNFRRP